MPVFTVHEPPPRAEADTADPDRFVFVRDGFHVWAFLIAPLWMLRHRLWLVLLLYIVAIVALQVLLSALNVTGAAAFTVSMLLSLLVGFEAASLRRWTYARRRWKTLGLVVASDLESAERRFFDSWVTGAMTSGPSVVPDEAGRGAGGVGATGARMPSSAPTVIGLFPEPQSRP